MAWNFTKDVVLTNSDEDVCSLFYLFKEDLKTHGWVVTSSGTGTAGAYDAAGDLITSAGAFSALARAWIAMRSPDSAIYFTLQRTSSGAWRFKVAIAPFNAGSPGANQTPTTTTASDEFIALGGGTDASPTGAGAGISATSRIHWAIDDAAPYGFVMLGWTNGGGTPLVRWIYDPLLAGSYPAGDIHPWVMVPPAIAVTFVTQFTQYNTTAGSCAPFLDGATWRIQRCVGAGLNEGWGSTTIIEASGTNVDGEDTLLPHIWARRATHGGGTGVKGISSILRFNGTARASGDTISSAGARDRIVLPPINSIWDGSVPTV